MRGECMKYRLLEWILAPLALILIAMYEVYVYWHEHRIVAIFFIIGGLAACWLLIYGTRRFFVVRRYKKQQLKS